MLVEALGALLDRSVVEIAGAVADGRSFDRQAACRIADVWDNNTFPLFGVAATRPGRARERRARAALVWMAEFGAARRAWMVDQARSTGVDLESVLPCPPEERWHRDFRGAVRPSVDPLTPSSVEELQADYDLDRAEVRAISVERVGCDRLCGWLEVGVPRRYPNPMPQEDLAELRFDLDDVTQVRFDATDTRGTVVTVTGEAAEMRIGIGTRGEVSPSTATVMIDDMTWHLSAAGRAADARTPRRRTPRQHHGPGGVLLVPGSVIVAAHLVHRAMLEIRVLGNLGLVGRIPAPALLRLLDGAGSAVMSAGAHRLPATRGAAFRRLVEHWCDRSRPDLAGWTAARLRDASARALLTPRTRSWVHALATDLDASAAPEPQRPRSLPAHAELRLVKYTAAHSRYDTTRPASIVINLAVPPQAGDPATQPWGLRAVEFTDANDLHLTTTAFHAPGRVHLQGPPSTPTVTLHDGALTLQGTEVAR